MPLRLLLTSAFGLFLAGAATAQSVYLNDLSIKGSGNEDQLCVGDDCADDEIYAADKVKIRLKDENTALEFYDVNGTDWIVETNQGASDNLRISNETDGRTPVVIHQAAASNTLFVSSEPATPRPRIGLGTSLPEGTVHVVSQQGVGVILEDTALNQKWTTLVDLAGYTLLDDIAATSPFRIAAGAPSSALQISSDGNIGAGTSLPGVGLHVSKSNGTGAILIEETSPGTLGQMTLRNNGITFFRLEDTSIAAGDNTGRAWNFQNQAGTFRITTAPGGPGEIEMIMTPAGDMTIKGQLTTGGGTCGGGCDAVFRDDYDLPTIAEHAAEMFALGHLPNVGPTVENAPINVSDKLGRMLNALEYAHIYIAQQQEVIDAQQRAIDDMKTAHAREIAALADRLTALEMQ
ncbi:hypothetical protein EI983_00290 (plasmid) [Roseovarius faecimaris]|uniref:DUF1521 domain-containing protein n=1 Tax=Roseovarius faecimaris TaxID=2494550 RepID=A0A6I6IKH7_9RHOB|nr:hypothetical protein [Roseovarius faecimaris]QGX96792.1 hypothetical protein EI983_00290 [Roseovarius faecimaris]